MARPAIRELAHLFSVFHNLTYYAPEMKVFRDHGLNHYWHAYLAYRSAPMGRVGSGAVVATFYNFAPSLVEQAIPAAWDILEPSEVLAVRDDAVGAALHRVFGAAGGAVEQQAAAAAALALPSITNQSPAGRTLFAAHAALPTPDPPLERLWHAATLWREFRGDGHAMALLAEHIDGIECHVLLAGKGVASQSVIQKIRGWSTDDWHAAHQRLATRGLVEPDGVLTADGSELRRQIETRTDQLASGPLEHLGPDEQQQLIGFMTPLVQTLVETGAVPDRWPPPTLPA